MALEKYQEARDSYAKVCFTFIVDSFVDIHYSGGRRIITFQSKLNSFYKHCPSDIPYPTVSFCMRFGTPSHK
jgi:hypothetical protein